MGADFSVLFSSLEVLSLTFSWLLGSSLSSVNSSRVVSSGLPIEDMGLSDLSSNPFCSLKILPLIKSVHKNITNA